MLLAVVLSGCAALGGVGTGRASDRSAAPARAGGVRTASRGDRTVARADRTHEVPTPAAPERVSPSSGWTTPERAVRGFAGAYVNWSAATVSGRLRSLARRSVGQARAALELQAREVAADTELRRGGIANAGTVQAVAPLAGSPHRFVVVTRERTTGANDAAYRGLAPEWHLSLATVTRVGRRWVVSAWQPES